MRSGQRRANWPPCQLIVGFSFDVWLRKMMQKIHDTTDSDTGKPKAKNLESPMMWQTCSHCYFLVLAIPSFTTQKYIKPASQSMPRVAQENLFEPEINQCNAKQKFPLFGTFYISSMVWDNEWMNRIEWKESIDVPCNQSVIIWCFHSLLHCRYQEASKTKNDWPSKWPNILFSEIDKKMCVLKSYSSFYGFWLRSCFLINHETQGNNLLPVVHILDTWAWKSLW